MVLLTLKQISEANKDTISIEAQRSGKAVIQSNLENFPNPLNFLMNYLPIMTKLCFNRSS